MPLPKGTHGTTWSRGKSIQEEGFRLSNGRVGRGAYFWRESPYAYDLAVAWWDFSLRDKKSYEEDEDVRCAVIWASFRIKEEELLDLTRKDVNDGLAAFARKRNLRAKNEEEVANLRAWFISWLGEKMNVDYKVIETSITLPPKRYRPFYSLELLGNPSCYLVKSKEVIRLDRIRYIQ